MGQKGERGSMGGSNPGPTRQPVPI